MLYLGILSCDLWNIFIIHGGMQCRAQYRYCNLVRLSVKLSYCIKNVENYRQNSLAVRHNGVLAIRPNSLVFNKTVANFKTITFFYKDIRFR